MKEVKAPGIKLFGKKIDLPENGKIQVVSVDDSAGESTGGAVHEDDSSDLNRSLSATTRTCLEDEKVNKEEEGDESDKDHPAEEHSETKPQDKPPPLIIEESTNSKAMSESDNPKTPSIDEETTILQPPKTENDQGDATDLQQKTLKKPDKILQCPRCNSMDTKFCYYNNYNINQPRHFCKSCQRYWTAGGTTRNVPVGAGRRKNKNSTLYGDHINISEALQAAQIDVPNGIHKPTFKTVLSFGINSPLCESVACVLNLEEKKALNGTQNGFSKVEHGLSVSCKGEENGNDCSGRSSATTSTSLVEGERNGLKEPMMQQIHGFPSQVPCLPGVPWPYPWNSAVPVPAIYPAGFPMPFYPAPYWNCSVPGPWSIPWLPPPSTTTNQKMLGLNLPTLGKHSRDEEESLEQKNSERSILIPKTLRIDDPEDAAKSSIWATLGIKNDSISRGKLFKAFESKSDECNHALQANPAALSRSLSFQERA